MKRKPRLACPTCGNEFSGAMEFCPVCMLHTALASEHDLRLGAMLRIADQKFANERNWILRRRQPDAKRRLA